MILVVSSILMYYYNMIRMKKKNSVKINKSSYLTIKLWLGFYLSNIIYKPLKPEESSALSPPFSLHR